MRKVSITPEKLARYQSKGYWRGMTLDMCRYYESQNYWPGIALHDFFYESVKKYPGRDFIVYSGKRFTYQEANHIIRRLAIGLLDLGFKKGDVICVLLHNCPEMAFLQIALSQIGAVIQPIHLVYRELEIKKRIAFCEARAMVIPAELKGTNYVNMIRNMQKDLNLEMILVVDGQKDFGQGFHLLESVWAGVDPFTSLADPFSGIEVDANDVLFLNFTSGTENDPKGFLHTHNTLLGNLSTASYDICRFVPGEEVLLSFSPMTHSFGHAITYIASMTGATMVMVDTYDPGKTLELVEKERITFLQGTPTHFLRFLDHPDFGKYNLGSLRILATGGAAIPPALTQRLKKETGAQLTVWFGMGEDGIHTAIWPGEREEVFLKTVGKTLPGEELSIYDDQRNPLGPGQVGEIANRGAAMFLGYFKNPEMTERTRNNEGWFFTGDTGLIDQDGTLRLYGRKKEMINRGGTKIFPLTVENILCFHPKIQSVAVVGYPDRDLGERVCACIIPKMGETISLEEIAEYMRGKGYSRYEIPEKVVLMNEFPMTPTGKVKKDLLQKEVSEQGLA